MTQNEIWLRPNNNQPISYCCTQNRTLSLNQGYLIIKQTHYTSSFDDLTNWYTTNSLSSAMSGLAPEEEESKRRKRQERLEQNRISARESRKRKKCMIEELQKTVIVLSRENKELNERNEGLRRQLIDVGSKVSLVSYFCFKCDIRKCAFLIYKMETNSILYHMYITLPFLIII